MQDKRPRFPKRRPSNAQIIRVLDRAIANIHNLVFAEDQRRKLGGDFGISLGNLSCSTRCHLAELNDVKDRIDYAEAVKQDSKTGDNRNVELFFARRDHRIKDERARR